MTSRKIVVLLFVALGVSLAVAERADARPVICRFETRCSPKKVCTYVRGRDICRYQDVCMREEVCR